MDCVKNRIIKKERGMISLDQIMIRNKGINFFAH